jgi:gluconokinase
MTGEPLALTLDVGTSSTRVLLWDGHGREVEGVRAQVQYQMHTTPDGGVEMPAPELLAHVADCVDQAMAQIGERAANIRVVGMSTFWHSVIGLDANGDPITPLYNWADQRSGAVAQRLQRDLDTHAIHQRTGCVIHSSYYPAKLVWLRETQRELYDRVERWASPSEYLYGCWFGPDARRVSVSMASGTGLFNQQQNQWDEETLRVLDIPIEKLSPIVNLTERAQGLGPEWASRWPALGDVPFFPAVGDGACGNVGSGCITPLRFAINLGTSGAIRALWTEENLPVISAEHQKTTVHAPQLVIPNGLWRYRADSHRPLLGAAFSDGGVVYAWLTRTLQLPAAEDLEQQLARMEPGQHGLTFLPFLAGERSLGWNPNARAALLGMNLDTNPVEIVRASMEAIALRFALAAQRLRDVFPQAAEIIASGGVFAHSPTWAQMFADAIGQPMTLALEAEASSRGAALLALEAVGLLPSAVEAEARLGQTYAPDLARHARYQELLATQQKFYTQLIEQQNI